MSKHKYAEPFSNGRLIVSIYLDAESTRAYIDDIVTDISLIYINPENELSPLIRNNVLSVHEAFYARSAWKFTHQFLSSFNTEYIALTKVLQDRPYLIDILNTLRGRLVKDTYTESRIVTTISTHPQKIRQLYNLFAHRFEKNGQSESKPAEIFLEDVPHDVYGMTTTSVHEYVLGILKKLNIDEEAITKVQTGGPDGDLGGNEILISKDKTLCVIDGSGVLFDPEGLDRPELIRLAKKRVMSEHFDRSKLSRSGFFVHINQRNVTLPDGQTIENGLDFRNTFHLNPMLKADLFVPCGGRPKSINIQNWEMLLDEKGKPRFKFIVEGANLFLTQPARLVLEEKGVIIVKDASANKGGVTSSSLEVLASLVLTDEEYDLHMCVKDGRIPDFRKNYVSGVMDIIRNNASLEFEVLWQENKSTGTTLSILTDQLSDKINKLIDSIHESDLWKDKALLRAVVKEHCPPALVKMVSTDEILRRVPGNYLQAIFASWLASHFIYNCQLQGDEIDFHKFLEQLKSGASQS